MSREFFSFSLDKVKRPNDPSFSMVIFLYDTGKILLMI